MDITRRRVSFDYKTHNVLEGLRMNVKEVEFPITKDPNSILVDHSLYAFAKAYPASLKLIFRMSSLLKGKRNDICITFKNLRFSIVYAMSRI